MQKYGFDNRAKSTGVNAFKGLPLLMQAEHENPIPDFKFEHTVSICRTTCDDHYKTLFIRKPNISFWWGVLLWIVCGGGSWFGIGGIVKWANGISTGMALANMKSDIRHDELIEVKDNVKALQSKVADISPAIETLTNMVSENNKILRGKR